MSEVPVGGLTGGVGVSWARVRPGVGGRRWPGRGPRPVSSPNSASSRDARPASGARRPRLSRAVLVGSTDHPAPGPEPRPVRPSPEPPRLRRHRAGDPRLGQDARSRAAPLRRQPPPGRHLPAMGLQRHHRQPRRPRALRPTASRRRPARSSAPEPGKQARRTARPLPTPRRRVPPSRRLAVASDPARHRDRGLIRLYGTWAKSPASPSSVSPSPACQQRDASTSRLTIGPPAHVPPGVNAARGGRVRA